MKAKEVSIAERNHELESMRERFNELEAHHKKLEQDSPSGCLQ
jgi:cell division protein FtsB